MRAHLVVVLIYANDSAAKNKVDSGRSWIILTIGIDNVMLITLHVLAVSKAYSLSSRALIILTWHAIVNAIVIISDR